MEENRSSYYRPEIDGLRAVAVSAVVLFHISARFIPGGYVGVDVFFVISGYLISQIILREIDDGSFSFGRFYERRARRILPALFVVLAVSACLSLILLPNDFEQFSKSLVAVPLFLSNFLFWYISDYFGNNVNTLPLVHTWSLAIEEQFYIAFPVCLLLFARYGRRAIVTAILIFTVVSLALCVWETSREARSGFYMPYTRAWELMIGALLATGAVGTPQSNRIAEMTSRCGFGMILASMLFFTTETKFPGYMALLPCVGTAMVLYGTQRKTYIRENLSAKPLVKLGLISYSLYLWHWPLIVFASYYFVDPGPVRYASRLAAVVSVPLAYLSWRYIEQPFRRVPKLLSRRELFGASFAVSALLCLIGGAGWAANGLPGRFPAFVAELTQDRLNSNADCDAAKRCVIGAPGVRPTFAVFGDSHAHALNNGLDHLARRDGVSGYAIYNLGCRPFLDGIVRDVCRVKNRSAIEFLQGLNLRSIIITAAWSTGTTARTQAELKNALEELVNAAAKGGATVYVMLDVPSAHGLVPESLAKYRLLGRSEAPLYPTENEYIADNRDFNSMARDLERRGKIHVLDPRPILCSRGICMIAEGDIPLYYDNAHLNAFGADKISVLFAGVLAKASR